MTKSVEDLGDFKWPCVIRKNFGWWEQEFCKQKILGYNFNEASLAMPAQPGRHWSSGSNGDRWR